MLHQQLVAGFLPVIAVLAVVLAVRAESPRRRTVALCAFFGLLALQMWAGFYWAWYLIFSMGLALVWALASPSHRSATGAFLREQLVTLGLGAAAFLAVSTPMILRHLAAASEVGLHDFGRDVLPRTAHLASWLYMGTPNLVYGLLQDRPPFQGIPIPVEQQLASGIVTTVAALWGLWRFRHRALVQAFIVVGGVLVLVSTVLPGGFTPWRWVYELLPGAGAIRAPARTAMVLLLPLSAGFALALAALEQRGRYTLAALLLAVGIVEQVRHQAAYDKLEARSQVAEVVEGIDEYCAAFYAVTIPRSDDPLPYNPWKYHLDAMWAQLDAGIPTVNGYSGFQAPGWRPLYENVIRDQDDRRRVTRLLREWVGDREGGPVCVVEVLGPEGTP
jgi:hypothetical protein